MALPSPTRRWRLEIWDGVRRMNQSVREDKNILNKELWENIPLLTHLSGKLHDLKIWEDTFRNFTGYPNFLKVCYCHQKVFFVFYSPRMTKIKPKLNKINTYHYYYLKSTVISPTESSQVIYLFYLLFIIIFNLLLLLFYYYLLSYYLLSLFWIYQVFYF